MIKLDRNKNEFIISCDKCKRVITFSSIFYLIGDIDNMLLSKEWIIKMKLGKELHFCCEKCNN